MSCLDESALPAKTGHDNINKTSVHLDDLHPACITQVLDKGISSYGSDVYSFGIVVWEVLTRQAPWANEDGLQRIVWRVVIKQERPEIPSDAPRDLSDLAHACWATDPALRPSSSAIMQSLKLHRPGDAKDKY